MLEYEMLDNNLCDAAPDSVLNHHQVKWALERRAESERHNHSSIMAEQNNPTKEQLWHVLITSVGQEKSNNGSKWQHEEEEDTFIAVSWR